MQKNLTLTIDEDLLREARKIALDRNTSVNQMVRDYLADLVTHSSGKEFDRKAVADKLAELFRTSKAEIGPITWTRDDLHERR